MSLSANLQRLGLIIVAWACISVSTATPEKAGYRIDFNHTEKRGGVDFPQGWMPKGTQWGIPTTKFYVTKDDHEEVLVVEADKATGIILFDVYRFVDLNKTPIMRWRWRVKKLPEGADGRNPKKDDQVMALYVGYGSMIRKSVAYRWDTETPTGCSGDVKYASGMVRVSWFCMNNKTTPLGEWVTAERNIAGDFKKIYGEIPKEFCLSVGGNSQYTKSHSLGEIDFIEFLPASH